MADIFETVIGMAEPALKMVGGFVGEVQATVQKVINKAVAEALKASGAGAAAAPAPEAPPARVRPLRAPGR
jgi:hypothetical protein